MTDFPRRIKRAASGARHTLPREYDNEILQIVGTTLQDGALVLSAVVILSHDTRCDRHRCTFNALRGCPGCLA